MLTDRELSRFMAKVDKSGGEGACWIWTASRRSGYGQFAVKSAGRPLLAHRLMFEISRGPIPAGMDCRHSCDVRECVNPRHLFIGTRAENLIDMTNKGRRAIGSRHGRSRIDEADVAVIRSRRSRGDAIDSIAADFGLSPSHVYDVARGKKWRHVALMPCTGNSR